MSRRLTRGLAASAVGAFCLSAVLGASAASPVADAAMQGDRERVRSLLKGGGDVNAAQGDGMTALHWAASRDDVELAAMLLYAGANVKAATRLGAFSPLHVASQNGSASMIDTLLKGGADPGIRTSTGTTPLMFAAASGSAQAVVTLLEHGADVNARETAKGETALMFAAAFNRARAIEVLMQHGADAALASTVLEVSKLKTPEEEANERERRERAEADRKARERAAQKEAGATESPAAVSSGKPAEKAETKAAAKADAKSAAKARPAASAEAAKPAPAPDAAAALPADATAGDKDKDKDKDKGKEIEKKPQVAGVDRAYRYGELIGSQGGLTALLLASRQGYVDSARALLDAGADVNQMSTGDKTSPLLIAIVNGHFDLAISLLERGADPTLASENGVTPLYAALNCQWAPKSLYPQPRAFLQQKTTHVVLMAALLDKGADPNVRLTKKVWYSGYNFDLAGVDEVGATPFWRAAYASDLDAMRLLVARGADPNIPTTKPPGRPRTGDSTRETKDVSGLPPVPIGGPSVTPLQAAAGVGYGEGFAANSHRFAPTGMLAAVKYLVEELGADVNARDHEGNTALHHAAARGDVEMIEYLVSKGADVMAVNREGQTTADMANGPVQRTQPFPEALALLEKLGAKNNHKCVSC